jgi:hypothetical protein
VKTMELEVFLELFQNQVLFGISSLLVSALKGDYTKIEALLVYRLSRIC